MKAMWEGVIGVSDGTWLKLAEYVREDAICKD